MFLEDYCLVVFFCWINSLEILSLETNEHTMFINEDIIELFSAGWEDGNRSSIRINGTEHSQNSRGLNVVVFNQRTGIVEDSVSFDTHGNLAIHR